MAMKILLLMMVMALGHGTDQTCRRRQDLIEMHALRAATRCSKPQESLVQLPVPAGYDYVKPDVAKVKQCTGLFCQVFPEKCIPDPQYITTKTYKVYAFRDHDFTRHCVEVEVEEHGSCNCQCEKTVCSPSEVFNEKTCECECNPEKQLQCHIRRQAGESVMWSQGTCSCVCEILRHCDTSMIWDQELCRCVDKDELDYLDYTGDEI